MGYILVGPETHCPAILGEHAKAFSLEKKKKGSWPTSSESNIWLGIYHHQWRSVFFFAHTHHTFGRKRKATVEEREKRKSK